MAINITEDERKIAFESAGSGLKFLLDREGVSLDFQGKLFHVGVSNVKQFAVFAEDRAELRKLLKDNFEIDAEANITSRVAASKIVVAWESAKARSSKQAEIEGESEARKIPKDISPSDFHSMRAAYESRHWELEDRRVPGRSYLEKKLDEIEKDELRAELLSEVIAQDEDDPDSLRTVWSTGGELRAVKVGAKSVLPSNPEELRKRITLMGIAWQFVAFQQTHRDCLKELSPQLFQEYLDYLLGDFVCGMCAQDSRGALFAAPSWNLIISYEQAIRCKAVSLTRKGLRYNVALKKAWEDPIVKERFFSTPLTLEATKRPFSGTGQYYEPPAKHSNKGKGKGKKGGGKGKRNGGGEPGKCARTTPDGKPICYRYNSQNDRCKTKGCKFLHVCGLCYGTHPMHECPNKGAAPRSPR